MRLRKVRKGDLEVFYGHQRDPAACERANFTPREHLPFLEHWHGRVLGDPSVVVRTVLVEGRIAGNIVGFSLGGRREVGYWLGREYWGRGIATEALARFLRIERERPLFAVASRGNPASVRVLEKCGFTPWAEEGDELTLRLG